MTIDASSVTFDGFSLTNPGVAAAAFGVLVQTAGAGATIANNLIANVSSTLTTSQGTAQAIYLENGPDNVLILGNSISQVVSDRSAKGILIGDSAATDASQAVTIVNNTITGVTSTTRGAYGITTNNGTGANVTITGNSLSDLNGGGWVHAIGLEGDTTSPR